jgi:hypothetical protein
LQHEFWQDDENDRGRDYDRIMCMVEGTTSKAPSWFTGHREGLIGILTNCSQDYLLFNAKMLLQVLQREHANHGSCSTFYNLVIQSTKK